MEAAGVSIIQKDCVSLQTKIALGRPYSGDVYNAQLTQGHNKVDCEISLFVKWLAWLEGRMSQILCRDWLPECVRWHYHDLSAPPADSRKKNFLKAIY